MTDATGITRRNGVLKSVKTLQKQTEVLDSPISLSTENAMEPVMQHTEGDLLGDNLTTLFLKEKDMADKTKLVKETSVVASNRGQGYLVSLVSSIAGILILTGKLPAGSDIAIAGTVAAATGLLGQVVTAIGFWKAKKADIPSIVTSVLPKK